MLAQADEGRVIREGRRVVLAGPVNAGKSSLFNRLADMERAIVAATPGTTRDLLIERVDIGGIPETLVDTAGLRASADEVEAEGVRRAERAAETAAVTVLVLDRSFPLRPHDRDLLARGCQASCVIAANKADLPPAWTAADAGVPTVVETSARTGHGMSALRDDRSGRSWAARRGSVVGLLREVERSLIVVPDDLNAPTGAAPEEAVLPELAAASAALDELSGARAPEDILAHIFARFCIGK